MGRIDSMNENPLGVSELEQDLSAEARVALAAQVAEMEKSISDQELYEKATADGTFLETWDEMQQINLFNNPLSKLKNGIPKKSA